MSLYLDDDSVAAAPGSVWQMGLSPGGAAVNSQGCQPLGGDAPFPAS